MRWAPSTVTVLMASSEETAFVSRINLLVRNGGDKYVNTYIIDSSLDLSAKFLFFISSAGPEKGLFDDMTDDEVLVLQQMFFGVVICALATLAAKGDMVFTAIFIGGVAAMAGYWLTEKGDYMLDGFLKGR